MFQPWRIKLREAQRALEAGRLDEARQLLGEGDLAQFQPARRLMTALAEELTRRALAHSQRGDTQAGWRDVETAAALGAARDAIDPLRQRLIERAVEEIESDLAADDLAAVEERLAELARRKVDSRAVRQLRAVAARLRSARRHARRAAFAEAEAEIRSAAQLRPELKFLEAQADALRAQGARSRQLHTRLHEVLSGQQWTEALGLAEELLAIAPDDQPARDARRRAWAAVGTAVADSQPAPAAVRPASADTEEIMSASTRGAGPAIPRLRGSGPRLMLWVDAVGGYLLCLGETVVLGQPVPGEEVDVPLLGDLSSRHALIRRSGEGYLLEALRPTRVDGRPVSEPVALTDGSLIELGRGVQLRFRRPHPLSATARLEPASGHRTQPPVDAVLLLAEACVLGPAPSSHVVCRRFQRELVLYRQDDRLACRTTGPLAIDDRPAPGGGPLQATSRIEGDDFSLRLEPV